jgi:hypothetical protein
MKWLKKVWSLRTLLTKDGRKANREERAYVREQRRRIDDSLLRRNDEWFRR